MEKKILHNKVRCLNCTDIIESLHTHHFVVCSCWKNEVGNKGIAVDGGKEYLRRVGDLGGYVDLSEYEESKGLIGRIKTENKDE